jgi:hypothetical protein
MTMEQRQLPLLQRVMIKESRLKSQDAHGTSRTIVDKTTGARTDRPLRCPLYRSEKWFPLAIVRSEVSVLGKSAEAADSCSAPAANKRAFLPKRTEADMYDVK